MKKLLTTLFMAALTASPLAAEIRLASGGKTDYTVVAPENPTRDEQAAAEDLAATLSRITGAKFPVNGEAPKKIYVGRRAPSDRTPLKAYERRVMEEHGDLYCYGDGLRGNTFAVYDCLEKCFDCRWYTFYGDECIPEKREAVFDRIDLSVVPSFDSFSYYGGYCTTRTATGDAFRRRARIYNIYGNPPEPLLGADYGHILGQVLPPGVPLPAGVNPFKPPLKYFRDKAYFKTNPEFFSMDNSGKRIPEFQVCFSNPELRKTLIGNFETVVKSEYRGGPARLLIDLNDKGHAGEYFCRCPECMKLCEKYGSTAGPYWEFVLEICAYFKDRYPQIKLRTSAYGLAAVPPSKIITRFPANLAISIAPLGGTNFLRSYGQTPEVYRDIRTWGTFVNGSYGIQLYPTTYPRPLHTYPLVADINRLVTNMREAKHLGVNEVRAEFGCYPHGDMGFNELRVYLLAALTRNVDADADALTKDFMDHYYGAASALMRKYLAELEKCEAAEPNWMRYWFDHRSVLQYLTPENLLRWQGYFDEMEKLTADDPKANLHVRRCRTNLDEATMSVWYKFKPGEMPDRDLMNDRYQKTLNDSFRDMLATFDKPSEIDERVAKLCERRGRAMYYHYALAGKWRPLPEKFAKLQKAGKLFRLVPHLNRQPRPRLSDDPAAAAGIAVEGQMPKRFRFMFQYWHDPVGEKPPAGASVHFRNKVSAKRIPDDGKYHYHYVGTSRLYRESLIHTAGIRSGSGVMTGLLYDPTHPEQRFDIYISLKREGQKLWFDEMLFVKSDRPDTLENNASAPAENERN